MKRLLSNPDIVPLYYQAYLDEIQNVFNPTVMNPLIDQWLTGVASAGQISAMKSFVVSRTNAVLAQIPQQYTAGTSLPVVNGYPHTTVPSATLSGTANASKTRSLLVNGQLATYNARTGAWTFAPAGAGQGITLVKAGVQGVGGPGAAGDTWRYLADGSNQGTAWHAAGFDDSAWKEGKGQLGYGDGDETTVLFKATPRQPSVYFRKKIAVNARVTAASLQVLYDDGAAVWINGTLAFSKNMDKGLGYAKYASASAENELARLDVPPGVFVAGDNVIAVMVKQVGPTSPDLSFALQLDLTTVAR